MKFLIGLSPTNKKSEKEFRELGAVLQKGNGEITFTKDWQSALGYIAVDKYSAVWMDWNILRKYYTDFYHKMFRLNNHLPLIILTDGSKIDCQLCQNNELLFAVISRRQMLTEGKKLLKQLVTYEKLLAETPDNHKNSVRPNGFSSFIGNTPAMLEIYRQVVKVATTDLTVLITGSSGSGKELVARTIHELSTRRDQRFISLNCAAIPENLLESELFGYEKGAFTGANKSKPGKFELAHQGTILLDEIGDMPSNLQAKLLRVLEDHTVERLGGTTSKKVDIRLLAATNQNLAALIKADKFRSDLHYRLNVIPIHLPPVRKKSEDIVLLSIHILSKLLNKSTLKINSISWGLIDLLKSIPISGNVRELENILTRVVFRANNPNLSKDMLEAVLTWTATEKTDDEDRSIVFNSEVNPLWKVEKLAIAHALSELKGNISKVASQLEISRTALYRKMKKYQLG